MVALILEGPITDVIAMFHIATTGYIQFLLVGFQMMYYKIPCVIPYHCDQNVFDF